MKNESLLLTFTLLLRYAFHNWHSKVCLLTCYVTDLSVITITMAKSLRMGLYFEIKNLCLFFLMTSEGLRIL